MSAASSATTTVEWFLSGAHVLFVNPPAHCPCICICPYTQNGYVGVGHMPQVIQETMSLAKATGECVGCCHSLGRVGCYVRACIFVIHTHTHTQSCLRHRVPVYVCYIRTLINRPVSTALFCLRHCLHSKPACRPRVGGALRALGPVCALLLRPAHPRIPQGCTTGMEGCRAHSGRGTG